jgi:hypothetical protein
MTLIVHRLYLLRSIQFWRKRPINYDVVSFTAINNQVKIICRGGNWKCKGILCPIPRKAENVTWEVSSALTKAIGTFESILEAKKFVERL